MAAYLQRKLAKLTHKPKRKLAAIMPPAAAASKRLPQPSSDNDSSTPLLEFVQAKDELQKLYLELKALLTDILVFLHEVNDTEYVKLLADTDDDARLQSYLSKIELIREILARDHMKVAFFGRTSNGKSAVINAMLHESLLPSGMGHTTSCFCQVAACDTAEGYIMIDDTAIEAEAKLSIASLPQLANAQVQPQLKKQSDEQRLVRVYWPRARCVLLRHDVVFVDSPGVDVTANLDDWIDRHCLNADVFVLVLNAESTMTRAEKHFFHRVARKISKPNVFILNNRWDAAAEETAECAASVRLQHIKRCTEFLCDELKVCAAEAATKRIFFISAREVLRTRLLRRGLLETTTTANKKMAGYQQRYEEFQHFEREFEACISRSALKTRFQPHCVCGRAMLHDLCAILQRWHEHMTQLSAAKSVTQCQIDACLQASELQIMQTQQMLTTKITELANEIERKVSQMLNVEIWWQVADVISNFHAMAFNAEAHKLCVYKRALNLQLETVIEAELQAQLFVPLAHKVGQLESEMAAAATSLCTTSHLKQLTAAKAHQLQPQLMSAERRQPFEFLCYFSCQQMCADFHEQLRFRFSWGITAMIQRFTGKMPQQMQIAQGALLEQRLSVAAAAAAAVPTSSTKHLNGFCGIQSSAQVSSGMSQTFAGLTPTQLQLLARFAFAALGTDGSIGCLLVAGLVLKTIGWRLLLGAGTLLGSFYLYERLSWTNAAKERAFKAQYTRHVTRKLRNLADQIASMCGQQAKAHLVAALASLQQDFECVQQDMSAEMNALKTQLDSLAQRQTQLQLLSQKAAAIDDALLDFEIHFLDVD